MFMSKAKVLPKYVFYSDTHYKTFISDDSLTFYFRMPSSLKSFTWQFTMTRSSTVEGSRQALFGVEGSYEAVLAIGSVSGSQSHLQKYWHPKRFRPNHHTQKQKFQVSGWLTDTNRNRLKPKWQVVPIWANQHPIGGEKCSDFGP